MFEYVVNWSIPNAGPAVNVLHFGEGAPITVPQDIPDAVGVFYSALAGYLPNDVILTGEPEVREIDEATGLLVAVHPVVPFASIPGSNAGEWAGGTGGRIVWATGRILNGRRVRGATFIVPTVSAPFNSFGQMGTDAIAAWNAAAATLIGTLDSAGLPLVVWSRPTPDRVGTTSIVLQGQTAALAATLRERKY